MKLERSIINGKNKICPCCNARLTCSSYNLQKSKYTCREFWCRGCAAKFNYEKVKNRFVLKMVDYKLSTCSLRAYYGVPVKKVYPNKVQFRILPNTILPFKSFDYSKEIVVEKELDFPLTKDQLEDKVSLYFTFS